MSVPRGGDETRIAYAEHLIEVSDDPQINILASALAAIEREIDTWGWDQNAHIWQIRLYQPGVAGIYLVPDDAWRHPGHDNPIQSLAHLAAQAPPPPSPWPVTPLAQAPHGFAGLAFTCEAWALPTARVSAAERAASAAGQPVSETHPERVEVRVINAVDINGNIYQVGRERGGPPQIATARYGDADVGDGDMRPTIDALAAMVHGSLQKFQQTTPAAPGPAPSWLQPPSLN